MDPLVLNYVYDAFLFGILVNVKSKEKKLK